MFPKSLIRSNLIVGLRSSKSRIPAVCPLRTGALRTASQGISSSTGKENSKNPFLNPRSQRSSPFHFRHCLLIVQLVKLVQPLKADHPRDFLSRYSGIVVTDEYQAYHTIDNEREDLTVAGYWIHAKRGFSEVIKSLGETDSKGTRAKEAADRISMIFHLDNRLDGLSVTERKRRRNIDIKPKFNDFFALVKNISTQETSVVRQPRPCNTVLIKKNISVYS